MLKIFGPSDTFDYYLNDPSTPHLTIRVPVPSLKDLPLKINVLGFKEGPIVQEDALRVQAASVLYSLLFTLDWVNKIHRITRWAICDTLTVSPRAGKRLNAYYNRFGLYFFYDNFPGTKRIVFSADSSEAVNHEFGHAILDAIRPDLWDLNSFEFFSFHEAFGDIISMLSSLHHVRVIEHALQETGDDLSRSNVISRISEELGQALHKFEPLAGRLDYCLRDAACPFEYVVPDSLPEKCNYTVLSREAHSFSRVFSSAWYKIFVKLYERYGKGLEGTLKAREIISHLTISALPILDKKKEIYQSMAESMIKIDNRLYEEKHIDILRSVFLKRNIIPLRVLY